MLIDQLLGVLAFSTPAALIVTAFVWWGLYSKSKRTPTLIAALRSLLISIVACGAYAVARYQTPNDFFENGTTGVFVIALAASALMLVFFPGEPKADVGDTGTPGINVDEATTIAQAGESKRMKNISESIKGAWPLIALCTLITLASMFRYETVSAPFDRAPGMYVLDRWTGSVTVYTATVFSETTRRAKD